MYVLFLVDCNPDQDRIEVYHGSHPDAYTSLPSLEADVFLAPRLDHLRVLGTANFFGLDGLDVIAQLC